MLSKNSFGKNTDLKVSRLGIGLMGMSFAYNATNSTTEEESVAVIGEALNSGVNFYDTAAIYADGENEKLFGKALQKYGRSNFIVCTKVAMVTLPTGARKICGQKDFVKQSCYDSLARLGIDTIDILYQHRMDVETPIEETVGAFVELIKEGKIRYYGLSEAAAETIRRAHKVHPVACVQEEYSLWTRDIESNGVLATCRELGIAVVAYSPLGRGFLSGEIKKPDDIAEGDWRRNNPRFSKEAMDENSKRLAVVTRISEAHKCTTAQVAMAWLLHQGEDIVPIPGTRRSAHLQDNINSAKVALTPADLAALADVFPAGSVAGERYPGAMMSVCSALTKPL